MEPQALEGRVKFLGSRGGRGKCLLEATDLIPEILPASGYLLLLAREGQGLFYLPCLPPEDDSRKCRI